MKLANNKNLTIELTEGVEGVFIQVNGYDYCKFQSASIEEINLLSVVNWIENTYYTKDCMSSAYIPCNLNVNEFSI